MIRTFIQTDEFVKNWKRLGLNDDDMRRLELEILKNPQAGNVIKPELFTAVYACIKSAVVAVTTTTQYLTLPEDSL